MAGGIDLARGFLVGREHDGVRDVVGICLDNAFDLPVLEELERIVPEMKNDGGAAIRFFRGFHGEISGSFG